jgi:hypothetical protein
VKNLYAKIDNLNKKLAHENSKVLQGEKNIEEMNRKTKQLEKIFD